jgi:hypothetical protein
MRSKDFLIFKDYTFNKILGNMNDFLSCCRENKITHFGYAYGILALSQGEQDRCKN